MNETAFRFDPVEITPEAEQVRAEVRAFLAEHKDRMKPIPMAYDKEFSLAVAARGWVGMCWPEEYGGRGRSMFERYVVIEEMLAAGAPVWAHWIADRQSGPTILKYGTEEQKRFFLPRMASGEFTFCIGMSEPDSGSDLAGTRTRAVEVPGGYRVNGTKLWTSNAHLSDYMILFCRMAEAGTEIDRHSGAMQFLVDLKSPGIEIRPVYNLLGQHSFNEVHLSDLFVRNERLLGQPGDGWKQVMNELAFERSAPDRFLIMFQLLREMVRMARANPSPSAEVALGKLVAYLSVLRRMSISIAGMLQQGLQPNNEAAVVKDLGSRFDQELPEIARTLFPTEPALEAFDSYARTLAATTMNAPRLSIQGGTREILRGIIARGLGLR